MPGSRYRSIQNPRLYRALRRRGYSKTAAARISNARTPGHRVAKEQHGGVERADLPDTAFLDPERRAFPIMTARDVRAAVRAWGRYRGSLSFAEFKRRLIARARALGLMHALPRAWRDELATTLRIASTASGPRWVAVSATAFRDMDGEIVSRAALRHAVATAGQGGAYGPLLFWHVPDLVLGTCDYQALTTDGRVLIESGTFRSPTIGAAVARAAPNLQMSIGFAHPVTEPRDGVYTTAIIRERSIVPRGHAANAYTWITTKELAMTVLPDDRLAALRALLGDAAADELLAQVAAMLRAADQHQTEYKAGDPVPEPPSAFAPAPAPALTQKQDAAEGEDVDVIDLTVADLRTELAAALAPLRDAIIALRQAIEELRTTDKAASLADTVRALDARVAELEGEQPGRTAYRASESPHTVVDPPVAPTGSLAESVHKWMFGG